eukprot:CAMPEP_0119139218 /NCGR_PEP_ID=MMETSP1310-20130426/27123_1 /TAXON_ID=464262 /ORGANISM="Genus nov. species nov., Strain RCC2339" /LENGTH=231 /DNA_ID=CAMNT_0007130489 /DNA_START=18 /DNA_END=711 /DNA_ORIENTATION=+
MAGMAGMAECVGERGAGVPNAPVWPFEYSSTLVKTFPNNATIQWTKYYYDWAHNRSRFDFYTSYWLPYHYQEPPVFYVIYFYNSSIWFEYPLDGVCFLRTDEVPSVSPYWVADNFEFDGYVNYRGLPAEHWKWPFPQLYLQYFGQAFGDRLPMRSTNQINDLGATDYYDVIPGPQDPALFEIPPYCLENNQKVEHMDAEEKKQWASLLPTWPGWKYAEKYRVANPKRFLFK